MPADFPEGMNFRADGTGVAFEKGSKMGLDYGRRFDWNVPKDGHMELVLYGTDSTSAKTFAYKVSESGKRLDFLEGSPFFAVPKMLRKGD